MANLAIFKDQTAIATSGKREPSALAKSLATNAGGGTSRRIQTNTNGTFKRIVNGEQIGNAVRGEINVIIAHALPAVSRIYYATKYDPNGDPTLPNCWSNLGDKPEAAASDKQATSCAACPQNVQGSGEGGKGRACRYQRRISVLLEGDQSGNVYQFQIPAKSLFGKGAGNSHPFESYIKFLLANGADPDGVVTNIAFDTNADTMELVFTPIREVSDEEYELVRAAQQRPETEMYTKITVAQTDGVTKKPAIEAPAIVRSDEPDEEVIEEPVKRAAKKPTAEAPAPKKNLADVVSAWGDDE